MNGGLERIHYLTVSTLWVCGSLEKTNFTFSSLGGYGCHERTDYNRFYFGACSNVKRRDS